MLDTQRRQQPKRGDLECGESQLKMAELARVAC